MRRRLQLLTAVNPGYLIERKMEAGNKYFHEVVHLRLRRASSVASSRVFASKNSLFRPRVLPDISDMHTVHLPVSQRFFFIAICMLVN